MKTYIKVLGTLSVLITLGAGCFGGSSAKVSTGGIWGTETAGKSWTAMNALPTASGVNSIGGADILSLERDPSDAQTLYAGTLENGMLYSLDGGRSWQQPKEEAVRTGAVLDIEVDPRDVCTYYVLKPGRLIKTTTCGRTFNIATYVESRTDEDLTALALDWYNPNTVWLGTTAGDVYRSLDGGTNWTPLQRLKNDVTAIEISNADSRVILVGTANNGLTRSIDGGATWVSLEKDFKDYSRADRVHGFSQTDDGKTFALNTEHGLFTSADQGATWKKLNLITSQGEVVVYAMAVAPKDGQVIVYGTDSTLYRSTSGGDAWTTEELPSSRAASYVLFDPANSSSLLLGVRTIEED